MKRQKAKKPKRIHGSAKLFRAEVTMVVFVAARNSDEVEEDWASYIIEELQDNELPVANIREITRQEDIDPEWRDGLVWGTFDSGLTPSQVINPPDDDQRLRVYDLQRPKR